MPCCVVSHIEHILHLIQIRRQTKIKTLLIKTLQLISLAMIYCVNYKQVSPWITTLLALLSVDTLGYLAWCQERNIEHLSRSIVQLCIQNPPTVNEEDGLHQN